jgi:DHA1 family tetracycline resistance protein-like MFS transporter
LFLFYFIFGISYPTILGLYSASVSDDEQGWVMGVTVAVFTLVAGVMSLLGGDLMSISIRAPFYIASGAALISLFVLFIAWKTPEMEKLTKINAG